mmetsp:Transcript_32123/g.37172  ORF Transcript_32123/g.37172 Transcript_32123/m.37172 type:complete len:154 (-) Transcript_32123:523-984(-)
MNLMDNLLTNHTLKLSLFPMNSKGKILSIDIVWSMQLFLAVLILMRMTVLPCPRSNCRSIRLLLLPKLLNNGVSIVPYQIRRGALVEMVGNKNDHILPLVIHNMAGLIAHFYLTEGIRSMQHKFVYFAHGFQIIYCLRRSVTNHPKSFFKRDL